MHLLKKFKRTIIFLSKTYIDLLLISTMYFIWQTDYTSSTYERAGNFLLLFFYCIILYLFFKIYGVREIGKHKLSDTILSYFLALFLTNFFAYIQFCLIARKILPFLPIIYLCLRQFFLSSLGSIFIYNLYIKLNPPKKVLAVYSKKSDIDFILLKLLKEKHLQIFDLVDQKSGTDIIFRKINKCETIFIVGIESKLRSQIIEYCYKNSISIYIIPTITDLLIKTGYNTQISDTPILYCNSKNERTEFFIVKRLMDIAISIAALIAFAPIIFLIAVAIKLDDDGSILFCQDRITIDGERFKIYKFRTMAEGSDKVSNHSAVENDSRITRVGAVIRKIRMDEIPQFINILKGDMSVVGPRPESIQNVDKYKKEIPNFHLRHKMKAGLTGYAQIYGKYNTTAQDKLMLDLLYIQNASIFLDIKLIFSTIKIIFSSESTEGFDPKIDTDSIENSVINPE